ncbi:DUF3570 domain-containing protein [Arenibacter sp. GZD96]|uniref:DUF3570 domain-containing protein n=1 Tax=Aurantibrevibacter litoralis TaxID=3106030 RepID=UPI002AFE33B7|nr:DUF3570 domain-containing protein [Arenibacter sp. GZD-96]MEA1787434.1 DUF3570 domain-containing protein [Arenibacter sp. GZD-96]
MKNWMVVHVALVGCFIGSTYGQQTPVESYKKRVLETTEVNFLSSYYSQDGDNAAVTGGFGTEELTDFTSTFVVAIPLTDDDVLTIDAGISAYTSASSSNIDPFDSSNPADPFVESTGSSRSDLWASVSGTYTHSSDDRNDIWSATLSVANEYDYFSIGGGGSYTKLFNEKNTEVSVNGHVYIDSWKAIYPIEFRQPGTPGSEDEGEGFDINDFVVTGNLNFREAFSEFGSEGRNTYALGFGFSQILSKRLQVSLAVDLVAQDGLLSTPFHRIYFSDVEDTFIENFQLANDIERLPDTRFKVAVGGRLNYYINEMFVLRTFYRYYSDDWGISAHTASVELPVKIGQKFTVYPSYRYYTQTAADYFAPFEGHLSSSTFYTSDFDLSDYNANQYGFGINYTDIFAKFHLWKWGLKSIDVKYNSYDRSNTLSSSIITTGFTFVMD